MAEKTALLTEEEVDKMQFVNLILLLQEDGITDDDMVKLSSVEGARAEVKKRIGAQESGKHPGQAAEDLRKIVKTHNSKREDLAELCRSITAYIPKLDHSIKDELKLKFDCEVEDISRDVQNHLDKEECPILVAGETSAGKSTFLNLLLGDNILPVGILSNTFAICEVKYGETRQAVVHLRKSGIRAPKPVTIPLDGTEERQQELESYINVKGASRDSLPPAERVEIFLPLTLLQGGIVLVDSPGVGESEMMDQVVADYIPKVFAFLYIIDSSRAGGVQQDRLGRLLQLYAKKDNSEDFNPESALFICNKWDLVRQKASPEEQEEVKTEILRKLSQMWPGLEESQVVSVSMEKAVRRFGSLSEDFIKVLDGLDLLLPKSLDNKLDKQYRVLRGILSAALTHVDTVLNRARQQLDEEAKVEMYQEAEKHFLSFQESDVNRGTAIEDLRSVITSNMKSTKEFLSSLLETGKLKHDIILNTFGLSLKPLGLWHSNILHKLKNEKKELKFNYKFVSLNSENFSKLKDLYAALADDLAHCPSFKDHITSVESSFEQAMKEAVEPLESAYQQTMHACGYENRVVRQLDIHKVLFHRPSGLQRFVAFWKGVSLLSSRLAMLQKSTVQAVGGSQSKTELESVLTNCWEEAPAGTPLVDILISALSSSDELLTDLADRQMQTQRDLMALLEADITKMRTIMEHGIDQTFRDTRSNEEIVQTYEPYSTDINCFLGQLAMFHLTEMRKYEYPLDSITGWTDLRNRLKCWSITEVYRVQVPWKGAETKEAALKLEAMPYTCKNAWEFLKEEENLRKLKGDHIVEYHGTAGRREEGGLRLGLVMELCEGTLEDRIIGQKEHNPAWWGSDPEKQAAAFSYTQNLAVQLCKGLKHIHDAGYIHRDLKLSNILVTKYSVVKIADFGQTKKEVDITGTRAGTPLYRAPEVKEKKKYDKSADIYSLGLILWEMWYGITPDGLKVIRGITFSKRMEEDLRKGRDVRMPRWKEIVPPIPQWTSLIHDCLRVDPKERPEIQECLDRISDMTVEESKK